MLDPIPRRDSYVSGLVDHMDRRLDECKGDRIVLLDSLTHAEKRMMEEELLKVMDPSPKGVRYFLENYFVINTKGEDWQAQQLQTMYPFKEPQEVLWEDFIFCWENKVPTWWILLKARQIGWSTLVQSILFQRTVFNKLMKVLVIADEDTRSQNIFNMSLLAYNYLPFWMRPEKQYDNKGKGILHFDRKDDEERAVRPGLNSTFFVDAANKPSGSSRGFTLHGMHVSEFGLFRNPKIVTSDLIPAVAKRNPLVLAVIEGTADQSHNKAYIKMWDMAMKGKGLFRPQFAGWWREKTYCKPFKGKDEFMAFAYSKEEIELIGKIKQDMNYDIRRDQMAWYRDQADQFEATEGDRDRMEQEYPSYPQSAFRAAGTCYFPRKKLAQVEVRDVRRPVWCGDMIFRREKNVEGKEIEIPVLLKYDPSMQAEAPLWVWEWPVSRDNYYGASDPAQGIPGKDYSAAQVFRFPRKAGERIRQCMEYKAYADPKTLAKVICTMGKWYNTCEIAPETNTLTEHIANIRNLHQYPKIYRFRRQDKITNIWTTWVGWETNIKFREDLLARFKTLLVEDSVEIRSQRLLDEMKAFIDDGSGRFEASGDDHDDTLFAGMICVYCLMEADPNLFTMVEEQPLDGAKRDFQNTDHSNEEETGAPDTEFACL